MGLTRTAAPPYACFCDALADAVVEDQVMDAGTVEGISRCSRWMKHRMEEFRARLKVLQEKACTKEPGLQDKR